MRLGANYLGDGKCEFVVWAPLLRKVEIKLQSPVERIIPMNRCGRGYWHNIVEGVSPGTLYLYRLNQEHNRPDPASHFQPYGVHRPSQIIDHQAFDWEDRKWRSIPISEMIIYELHVGTFTPEGTLEAIISRLNELADLGINAIELMPVAQFPGDRNWGYDGVYSFAVQNSYGGPEGLKRLVNECHKTGLAVILDVVYNHMGPEGNYLHDYGPYFTGKYKTPWGDAINFDEAYSGGVRNFFIQNALHWFRNYHVDTLRLDAVHAIYDMSAKPFLQQLGEEVEKLSIRERRKFYLIAESNLNDSKIIRPRDLGGYGLDAQWLDDFHHSLHTLLTEENQGYYLDFGRVEHLVKSIREGFVYSGQYSQFRKRAHGNPSKDRPATQLVVFSQNHDQTGNRLLGERLSTIIAWEALKTAAGAVLFSPYVPLLFMGEEYAEEVPFLYFISHSDPGLVEAVRKGRKEEFKTFQWPEPPPDPQNQDTFLKSKINWLNKTAGRHKIMLKYHKDLIKLRKEIPALSNLDKESLDVWGFEPERVVMLRRWKEEDSSHVFCIFNFSRTDAKLKASLPGKEWKKIWDSSDQIWGGPGSVLPERITGGQELMLRGHSFAAYTEEGPL